MEVEKTLNTLHGQFFMRPYRDEDEGNVIDLWEAAFHQKMDKRVWRWKFHDNPFGRQIMLCLTTENLPIAMYAGIPFSANWNGENIRMTQLIDNMSHPDYRQATNGRKGLFIQTAEHFFEVYGGAHASVYHYGFPGKKHFRLGNLFLHYSMVSEGGAYLTVETSMLKKSHIPVFGHIRKVQKVTEAFDNFWEKAKQHYPFSIKRDSQFIQWRFFENPVKEYTIYTYKNIKGEIMAWAVISITDNTASIVDVLALPGSTVLMKLLWGIGREIQKKNISKIRIWLPQRHFVTNHFVKAGFAITAEPLGIIPTGRSLYEKLDIDFAKKSSYYTMGDGDLI